MTTTLIDVRADRVFAARQIQDRAATAGREQTAEERGQTTRLWAEVDQLEARRDRQQRADTLRAAGEAEDEQSERRNSDEYCRTFEKYLHGGNGCLTVAEQRALSAENDVQGGYTLAPMQMADRVLKALDATLVIRQLGTKIMLDAAHSVGVPVIDVDIDDADWTTELATGSEDTAMKFGKRELYPWPVAKRVRVTNKLLRRSKFAEPLVRDRLTYKLSKTFENAYLNGNGDKKPLGVFTASASGISTGRDVSTGNTTTSIGADGLTNAFYSLKESYLHSPTLRWIFHRDAVKQIRQLKDGTSGLYLWQPSLGAGEPDTILGVPVAMSEFAPNTFTAGLYAGLIGDLSYYWIADAGNLSIQVLSELYSASSLTGFIGRLESDGCPALEEAFARVKLATE